MSLPIDPATNHLLDALSRGARHRLLPSLEKVELRAEQVLHESGCPLAHAYFPVRGTVSLAQDTRCGASVELAMVGNDGIVGVELFLGGGSAPHRAVASTDGRGYRLSAQAMREEFGRGRSTMQLMLRYTCALITQISQTAVCNCQHTLKQRLCRWLLMTLDRQEGMELRLTHAHIGSVLGVRREGVTEAVLGLQRSSILRSSRGHMLVVDRQGLEDHACECHAVIRNEYDRLVSAPTVRPPPLPGAEAMVEHRMRPRAAQNDPG